MKTLLLAAAALAAATAAPAMAQTAGDVSGKLVLYTSQPKRGRQTSA